MHITVAICTRNRAPSLVRTLESFVDVDPPACSWELLVVDNGSSDDTGKVISSFTNRLPVRGVVEPTPGLSNARNRAVTEAQGDYMVWTDDDVLVDRRWLVAYEEAFARWPDAALFGGRILPVLEEPCVPWLRDNLELVGGPLALRDFGDEPLPLQVAGLVLPFGANFAVRTLEQRQFLYDPELGVAPGRRRLGEETTMAAAMLNAGHKGYWVPESKIQHVIGRERQTIRYVYNFYASAGETDAFQNGPGNGILVYGMPSWIIRRMLARYLSYRIARLTAQPEVWLTKLIELAYDQGSLAYWRRSATAPRFSFRTRSGVRLPS